jgi:hypothetical protein
MATVTYKNQPAIERSKGNVPLDGTPHIYTVEAILWPRAIEKVIQTRLIGESLHVCCGKSRLGTCRIDLHEPFVDVRADASALPFIDQSFDTVLIDPPYNGKFQWNHNMLAELARVARKRIIFQHWFIPVDKDGRFKKSHRFRLAELFAWQPKTYFGRAQLIAVMDCTSSEYV